MRIIDYKNHTPNIDKNAIIFDDVKIIGNVTIAKDCNIWYGSVIRGDVHHIHIDERTNIQDLTTLHVAYPDENNQGFVKIGKDVTIGHNCIIHGCQIEDEVLIGMGSIIMDNAHIGAQSIVGAGSLITKGKVFPPQSLIMGNPAKLIRKLTQEEIHSIILSAQHYVKLAKSYRI